MGRRRALVRAGALAGLGLVLMAGAGAALELPIFLYGQVSDVNPGSRVISVRADDNARWRFKITRETRIEKHLARPVPATFEDVSVGVRVRILIGSATMNPTIREALRIFVYP